MAGWAYLDGKRWCDITREERQFCLHLYNILQKREQLSKFLQGLIEKSGGQICLDPEGEWEVAFEVCLFRDLDYLLMTESSEDRIAKDIYSPKRTFDLCLFSSDTIILIEAKAQQGFQSDIKQLTRLHDDKINVGKLRGKPKNVYLVGIAASKAWEGFDALSAKNSSSANPDARPSPFDARYDWNELTDLFGDEGRCLNRAEGVYHPNARVYGRNSTGRASGKKLFDDYNNKTATEPPWLWVGRQNGINTVNKDREDGSWGNRSYEINNIRSIHPPAQKNWFSIQEFIAAINGK